MGNLQTKPLKNYALTIQPLSIRSPSSKPGNAYQKHLIDKKYETPGYGLKSKTHLNDNNIKSQVFLKPQCITLLTYNVWFEDHNTQNRYACLMKILADSKADIICLQQVNSSFLNWLHQSAKLFQGDDYFMPITKMHWYDTLILSKYPCRFYKKDFSMTGMGRCNLTAVVEFVQQNSNQSYKLAISCVHLESLNCQPHRISQLKEIEEVNKGMDMSIIAGDFNFSDGWQENKAIQNYTDVWKTGKRTFSQWTNEEMRESGYTMPPTTQFPPWRPDHIIYKSKNKQTKGQHQIAIIGDFTIPPYEEEHFTKVAQDKIVRTPSDHFGLISKIYIP